MKSHPGRKLTLLDAMILVAGTALGLGLTRQLSDGSLLGPFDPIGMLSPRSGSPWTTKDWAVWAVETIRGRFFYLIPLLVSWTVTVLALRMRKPRPRMTRLMAQPGAVACMTVMACITLQAAPLAIHAVREQIDFDYNFYSLSVLIVAYAVGSSWITLLIVGRWRAEPGWIDRLGRLLGLVWICPLFLGMIVVIFS